MAALFSAGGRLDDGDSVMSVAAACGGAAVSLDGLAGTHGGRRLVAVFRAVDFGCRYLDYQLAGRLEFFGRQKPFERVDHVYRHTVGRCDSAADDVAGALAQYAADEEPAHRHQPADCAVQNHFQRGGGAVDFDCAAFGGH